jgi:hypothetical protein
MPLIISKSFSNEDQAEARSLNYIKYRTSGLSFISTTIWLAAKDSDVYRHQCPGLEELHA